MRDVVIIDGVRTAIGKMGGSLSSVRPDDLLAHSYKGLIKKTGLDPSMLTPTLSRIPDLFIQCGFEVAVSIFYFPQERYLSLLRLCMYTSVHTMHPFL